MGIMSQNNLDLLSHLLQEVHRACYVKLSGATVSNGGENVRLFQ